MLNLDTHVLVHALDGDLTPREKTILAADQWGISAIVLWELRTLARLGRIDLDLEDPVLLRALSSIEVWPLDLGVCRAMDQLDFRSDPADEIIAATSLSHDVPLVTRDSRLRRSRVVPLAR